MKIYIAYYIGWP